MNGTARSRPCAAHELDRLVHGCVPWDAVQKGELEGAEPQGGTYGGSSRRDRPAADRLDRVVERPRRVARCRTRAGGRARGRGRRARRRRRREARGRRTPRPRRRGGSRRTPPRGRARSRRLIGGRAATRRSVHPLAAVGLHLDRLERARLAHARAPDRHRPAVAARPARRCAATARARAGRAPRRGRARSSARSAAPILSAYVTPSALCGTNAGLGSARTSSSSSAATLAARSKHRARRRRRAPIGNASCAAIGPGIELLDGLVDRHAGLGVAGEDRALDGRRAAPARQKRRVDVEPERARRAAPRGSAARRRRRRRSARRGRARRSGRSGWRTGMPSRSATTLAGGGATRRPRPRGASGRVSRRRDLVLARRAARARPRRTAPSRRRRSGPCAYLDEEEPRPQLRHRLAPRLRIGAIDDQHAVEMVELVLHDARREPFELEAHRAPRGVACPRWSPRPAARPACARARARDTPLRRPRSPSRSP